MANFSPEVIKLAQESQAKYGVPASVTLAQYATESGYGKSWLAKNANNYFGIIGSYNGQSVYRTDRNWRKYSSIAESFDDHGRLLSSGRYAEATKGVTSAEAYIDAIQPIYAPESDGNTGIAALWKKIIRQNNLTQYDTGVYSGGGSGSSGSSGSSGTLGDIGDSVLSAVVKGLAVLMVGVLAAVFFMTAFDLKIPTKKNLVKGAVSNV